MSSIVWPNGLTDRPRITSAFGRRVAPVPGASTNHRGTDFVGFRLVRAIADGTVTQAGTPRGWTGGGIQVWVQHDGFLTRSLHLASLAVRSGQSVRAGDVLGVMGMTGNVSGVHVHFEVVSGGVQVDPVPFISNRIATPTGGDSTSGEWDEMASREDVKRAAKEALDEVLIERKLGPGERNLWDTLKFVAGMTAQGTADAVVNKVWARPITALDENGNPIRRPDGSVVQWQAWGFLSSIAAQLGGIAPNIDETELAQALAPLITANLSTMTDADVQRIAEAVTDEQARRLAS